MLAVAETVFENRVIFWLVFASVDESDSSFFLWLPLLPEVRETLFIVQAEVS